MRRLLLVLPAGALLAVAIAALFSRQSPGPRAASPSPSPSPSPSATAAAGPELHRIVIPVVAHDLPKRTTLAAVGDVMLARSVGEAIVANGPETPFAGVAPILQEAGVAVANLECAISDSGEPAPKGFTFRAPPAAAGALTAAGIDVVSLANNHVLDYGPEALADTVAALDGRAIAHAGAGGNTAAARAPAIVTRGALRIAFLSYIDVPLEWRGFDTRQWEATASTPGVAWLNVEQVQADVAAARRAADLVVVLMHFGIEEQYVPNDTQRAQARAAIDAGAALVIGHHPHVLQPPEWYGNGLIVFSLGNFVFDGWDNPTNVSAIFVAELAEEGVLSYRLVPVLIDGNGFPTLAEGP